MATMSLMNERGFNLRAMALEPDAMVRVDWSPVLAPDLAPVVKNHMGVSPISGVS
jgi:hypothetical protein